MSPEEYALRKGKAKDLEKFIDILFFEYLDEERFQTEKAILYDEYVKKCNESQPDSYLYYNNPEHDKLLKDEYFEQLYGTKVNRKSFSRTRAKKTNAYKK